MSGNAAPLPNDPAVLKAMITALQAENQQMSATVRAHDLLVQALRIQIAKLKKQKFGASSEKIEREIPLVTLHSQCTAGQWNSWNWRSRT